MSALRAVQDEVGCRVCLLGMQSRPEVISVNEARDHIGVQLDGHTDPISLPRRTLMKEDKNPWDKCRHGGMVVQNWMLR